MTTENDLRGKIALLESELEFLRATCDKATEGLIESAREVTRLRAVLKHFTDGAAAIGRSVPPGDSLAALPHSAQTRQVILQMCVTLLQKFGVAEP